MILAEGLSANYLAPIVRSSSVKSESRESHECEESQAHGRVTSGICFDFVFPPYALFASASRSRSSASLSA
jgi:hypothetical protein